MSTAPVAAAPDRAGGATADPLGRGGIDGGGGDRGGAELLRVRVEMPENIVLELPIAGLTRRGGAWPIALPLYGLGAACWTAG